MLVPFLPVELCRWLKCLSTQGFNGILNGRRGMRGEEGLAERSTKLFELRIFRKNFSGLDQVTIDPIFFDLITEHAFAYLEHFCRSVAIAVRVA
jgi:hypothetical protein